MNPLIIIYIITKNSNNFYNIFNKIAFICFLIKYNYHKSGLKFIANISIIFLGKYILLRENNVFKVLIF